MNKITRYLLFGCVCVWLSTSAVLAQSALDGTSFQVSTYNLPTSIGTVRLIDVDGSECRADGGPLGDDVASAEACMVTDSGVAPGTVTFNAGPQDLGDVTITPTVVPFDGVADDVTITAFNAGTDVLAELGTWSMAGELMEYSLRTSDNSYPATDDEDFWGFSVTDIQYPNALPDAHVGLPFDEVISEGGNYVNTYFWFEDEDGPITSGYEVLLPEALGVGRHPLDPDREVIYPIYSSGQMDEQTDTVAGGSFELHSHGSILNGVPQIGNLFVLSDNTLSTEHHPDDLTGFGIGIHVIAPESGPVGIAGDFDADGELTAADIDLLSSAVGMADLSFDVNGDGEVSGADRDFWVSDLAQTFRGDADLNGVVEFPDFLALSGAFGTEGGWAEGDFNGDGIVEFPDFLDLSANFGSMREAAASVPEPSGSSLLLICVPFILGFVRRNRR